MLRLIPTCQYALDRSRRTVTPQASDGSLQKRDKTSTWTSWSTMDVVKDETFAKPFETLTSDGAGAYDSTKSIYSTEDNGWDGVINMEQMVQSTSLCLD
jgi:hypothetical protein